MKPNKMRDLVKSRAFWTTSALAIAAFAAVVVLRGRGPERIADAQNQRAAASSDPFTVARGRSASANSEAVATPQPGPLPDFRESSPAPFKTDPSGHLVTDEQTRLSIEKLAALNSPQAMQDKLQELMQTLPPAAGKRLADLVERYGTYTEAVRQTFPPEQAPASEQEALAQIATLHGLRAQHFGPEVANGFFAAEEETQRELIELMRLEKDQSLTLQERAEKAQTSYQRLSEIRTR